MAGFQAPRGGWFWALNDTNDATNQLTSPFTPTITYDGAGNRTNTGYTRPPKPTQKVTDVHFVEAARCTQILLAVWT